MSVTIRVDVADSAGYIDPQTDRVIFRQKNTIGAEHVAGRVVSTAPTIVELTGDPVDVQLQPGLHVITIRARGYEDNEFQATVPDTEETLTLRDILETQFDYTPEQINEAQRYAAESRAAATDSQAALARAEQTVGSAERVLQAEATVKASEEAAGKSADDAAAEATAARAARDAAEGHKTTAGNHATAAAASADKATAAAATAATDTANNVEARLDSKVAEATTQAGVATTAADTATTQATNAEASADTASSRADAAKTYMDTSWANRSAAIAAKNEAQAAQTGAQDARDAATTQATNAAGSADAAAASANTAHNNAVNAANQVAEELDDKVTAAQQAREGAETAATNANTDADRAEQAANSAAEVVASGIPDATTTIKGKLKLAGDLAGNADAPTVPGLANKVPVTTTANRIYGTGTNGENYAYTLAGTSATANSVAYRTSGGVLHVGTPTADAHAATKKYVDDAATNKVTTNTDQTITGDKTFATAPTVGGVPVVLNDDTRLAGVTNATSTTGSDTTADKIVKTWTDGYVHVNGTPTAGTHATPKSYVDSRVQLVSALPSSPDPNVLYLIPEE